MRKKPVLHCTHMDVYTNVFASMKDVSREWGVGGGVRECTVQVGVSE